MTKFINEENLTEAAKIIKQYIDAKPIPKRLEYSDITASNWAESTEYRDYPYAVDLLQNKGITESDFAEVVFDVAEATSGNYAPVAKTGDFGVRIYAKVNAQITIPQIIITGGA